MLNLLKILKHAVIGFTLAAKHEKNKYEYGFNLEAAHKDLFSPKQDNEFDGFGPTSNPFLPLKNCEFESEKNLTIYDKNENSANFNVDASYGMYINSFDIILGELNVDSLILILEQLNYKCNNKSETGCLTSEAEIMYARSDYSFAAGP